MSSTTGQAASPGFFQAIRDLWTPAPVEPRSAPRASTPASTPKEAAKKDGYDGHTPLHSATTLPSSAATDPHNVLRSQGKAAAPAAAAASEPKAADESAPVHGPRVTIDPARRCTLKPTGTASEFTLDYIATDGTVRNFNVTINPAPTEPNMKELEGVLEDLLKVVAETGHDKTFTRATFSEDGVCLKNRNGNNGFEDLELKERAAHIQGILARLQRLLGKGTTITGGACKIILGRPNAAFDPA